MRRSPTLILSLLLALGVAAACGDDIEGAAPPVPTTTSPGRPVVAPVEREVLDGVHAAWLTDIDDRQLTVELVEILTGDEAIAAAVADGETTVDDGLPNDVYIRPLHGDSRNQTRYLIDLAPEVTVELYDCTAGCQQVEVALGDLVDGTIRPFGGDQPLVTIDIVDGQITRITEQYLP